MDSPKLCTHVSAGSVLYLRHSMSNYIAYRIAVPGRRLSAVFRHVDGQLCLFYDFAEATHSTTRRRRRRRRYDVYLKHYMFMCSKPLTMDAFPVMHWLWNMRLWVCAVCECECALLVMQYCWQNNEILIIRHKIGQYNEACISITFNSILFKST